jgi:hypothetical protein
MLSAVRAGESPALVLRGEAGVGKSALLQYVAEQAAGYRILHAIGIESEMELGFAGLLSFLAPGSVRRGTARRMASWARVARAAQPKPHFDAGSCGPQFYLQFQWLRVRRASVRPQTRKMKGSARR